MDPNNPWASGKPTQGDAELIGERMAALVAAEVLSNPIRGSVADLITVGEQLSGTELYQVLYNKFVEVFQGLMEASIDGMRARADMAAELMIEAAAARRQASETSIKAMESRGIDGAPQIELLTRVSEESVSAADKIYSPVRDNLDKLVETAKAAEVMRTMQRRAQSESADQAHDKPCNDPDCKHHTNH